MQDFPSGLLSYLFKISYDNLSKYDENKKCVSMYSNHYKTDNIYGNVKITYLH